MSRLGKLPIEIPKGTEVKIQDGFIIVKGPKGELKQELNELVKAEIRDKEEGGGQEIAVSMAREAGKKSQAIWGLFRQLINNMVQGVNSGFEKKLEINGVGYRASVSGSSLNLNLGFSHPIEYKLPSGIRAEVEKNIITITGVDKQSVGEVAAQIRRLRKPEPYKGKGIKYLDEVIRRKSGKTAASAEK
ncbi:50S ribosomal protein L6 [Candidatus Falkowbacteria bacterium CG10_big_fil_rev_8_21_14_0_10_43_10]|uniref:Large ribosomal subunit protein uL6 n=1 Tax=Candidatus Falkowbacteria bacterium CG10_big_fil_rev_8_21_14_0_10_43_10 TaxID=1974567 RepID=A0A2H0V2M0_9BACT|nr:MAG: 50S ribosomal protein L6 [Candidatus Falkowbacteria bacterium CG10_big_fil_rev_8_21_14_0_10_43_10]